LRGKIFLQSADRECELLLPLHASLGCAGEDAAGDREEWNGNQCQEGHFPVQEKDGNHRGHHSEYQAETLRQNDGHADLNLIDIGCHPGQDIAGWHAAERARLEPLDQPKHAKPEFLQDTPETTATR
jgi:hypothetical protein